jgi:hypothetical protein
VLINGIKFGHNKENTLACTNFVILVLPLMGITGDNNSNSSLQNVIRLIKDSNVYDTYPTILVN